MQRIDSHQHFWQYNPSEHVWMNDSMLSLKKDFYPSDLEPLLQEINFNGCIAVQARQSMEETNWLLNLADNNNFIKGVVGWVDLRSPTIYQQLEAYRNNNKLVGVRHVVHDEQDDYFMLQPSFLNGIAALKEFDLTYDLLLFPKHIPVAVQLIKKFPDQLFVIDHIAKPFISKQEISPWKEDLKELAYYPNVYCKLSGMVTETNWNNWKKDDFKPYLDIVTESFGADKIMIGSDWPVCTLSGNYAATMKIVTDYANQFPVDISNAILGGNCIEFYKILNAD